MNDLFAAFKSVPNEQKKVLGFKPTKKTAQSKLDEHKNAFEGDEDYGENIDLSRPVSLDNLGSRHPISLVRNEIVDIFSALVLPFQKVEK